MEINKFALFLTTIYQIAGQSTPDDFKIYAKEIYSRIPKTFTDADIVKCYRKGVYKELNDYNYLSAVVFDEWMKNYKAIYVNLEASDCIERKQLVEKIQPTKAQIKNDMIKWVVDVFNSYKTGETKYFLRNASSIYDYLQKYDVIGIEEADMVVIEEKARLNVITTAHKNKIKAAVNDRLGDVNDCKNVIDSILGSVENGNKKPLSISAKPLLSIEIKRLCLQFWFDKLIEFDLDISDYLNF
jgi:hypothetical protein